MARSGRRKHRQRLKRKQELQAQRKGPGVAGTGRAATPPGGAADPFDVHEEAAALAEMLQGTAAGTADEVRKWASAQGVAPHPRLEEATQVMLLALLPAMAHADAAAHGEVAGEAPDTAAAIEEAVAMYPPEEREEIKAAVEQVTWFMQSFQDPASMLEAMGMSASDEEQEADEAS